MILCQFYYECDRCKQRVEAKTGIDQQKLYAVSAVAFPSRCPPAGWQWVDSFGLVCDRHAIEIKDLA